MKNLSLLVIICFCSRLGAESREPGIWRMDHLQVIKEKIEKKEAGYLPAYESILKRAERHMDEKLYSVTYKKHTPPSGDKHDYMSMAPYLWPDPKKPDGLPYITRDGQRNPELNEYDRNPLGNMCEMIVNLSLAYFYSGNETYAQKAISQLQCWFLDEETRMNPHLNYAQFVPGVNNNKGRSYGIIDAYSFIGMLDGVTLLENAQLMKPEDIRNLKGWFSDFLHWLETEKMALEEKRAQNNHSIAYDALCLRIALFVDKQSSIDSILNDFSEKRIFRQIEPDGSQPHELGRTLALHYTVYNLEHILDICQMAGARGKEIYFSESPDGRSISKAIQFIAPYVGKPQSEFPYQQISNWEGSQQNLCWVLRRAALFDQTSNYMELFKKNYAPRFSERNYWVYLIN